MKNNNIIQFLIIIAISAGFIWFSSMQKSSPSQIAIISEAFPVLIANESSFDFGSISMADGNVRHDFVVRNASAVPITIEKLYTSCMCTLATYISAGEKKGPFGMPGHGFVPSLYASLPAGEYATVTVEFDPAAHGPAGIGRIDRAVRLESGKNALIELSISANITP